MFDGVFKSIGGVIKLSVLYAREIDSLGSHKLAHKITVRYLCVLFRYQLSGLRRVLRPFIMLKNKHLYKKPSKHWLEIFGHFNRRLELLNQFKNKVICYNLDSFNFNFNTVAKWLFDFYLYGCYCRVLLILWVTITCFYLYFK